MENKQLRVLRGTIKALKFLSERVDRLDKAVEVLQKHAIQNIEKVTYDTRVDMFKNNHSNDCECNGCFEEGK
jgi:hypothetical protein